MVASIVGATIAANIFLFEKLSVMFTKLSVLKTMDLQMQGFETMTNRHCGMMLGGFRSRKLPLGLLRVFICWFPFRS